MSATGWAMKRSLGGFRGGAKAEFGSAIDVNPRRCPFSMKAFRLTGHTRKLSSRKNVQPEGVRPVHHRKHGGNESSNCTFERSCHSRLPARLLERPQGASYEGLSNSLTVSGADDAQSNQPTIGMMRPHIARGEPKAVPTSWARDHDACLDCGTSDRSHRANGRCKRCDDRCRYAKQRVADKA
jgi:hypothetical protein